MLESMQMESTPLVELNDAALAAAWSAGDERAFEQIVARHAPRIFNRCRFALGAGDADDATQAVFLVLARKGAQAAASPVLAAWLMQVAGNVVRNVLRDRGRRRRAESQMPPPPPTAEEQTMSDIAPHLDACLADLPAVEREAVALHHLAGCTLAEVGVHTGAGISTVHARVQRGLERLRTLLAQRGVALGSLALIATLASEAQAAAPEAVLVHLRDLTPAGGGAGSTAVPSHRVLRWSQTRWSPMSTFALTAAGMLLVGGAVALSLPSAEPVVTAPPLVVQGEPLKAEPDPAEELVGWHLSVSFGQRAVGTQRVVATVWRTTKDAAGDGLDLVSVLKWNAEERLPARLIDQQRTSTGAGLLLTQKLGPDEVPVHLVEGRAHIMLADTYNTAWAMACATCSIETSRNVHMAGTPKFDVAQKHPDPLYMEDINRRSSIALPDVPAELPLPEGLPVLLAALAKIDLESIREHDLQRGPDCPRERLVRSLKGAVHRPITLQKLPAPDVQISTF